MHSFRFKLYAALLVTILADCIVCDKGRGSDFTVFDGYCWKRCDGACFAVRTEVSGDYDDRSDSVCGRSGMYATNIKETGQTFVPMIASFVAVGSNALLDYLLIFGVGPIPKLGVEGAAIATVMARYIEAAIVIIWAHVKREQNRYLEGAYAGFGIPLQELKTIIIKGLPLMLNEVLWAAGMTTVTQCYSVRGLDVVAGLNIATTITNLFNIVYIQLGACISIVVGQYLGAGQLEEAKDADNKMIVFSVFCCVIMALIMLLVGGFFHLFTILRRRSRHWRQALLQCRQSLCRSVRSVMLRILHCVRAEKRW